jgi:hypothetical protein
MKDSESSLRAIWDELIAMDKGLGPASERSQPSVAEARMNQVLVPFMCVEE